MKKEICLSDKQKNHCLADGLLNINIRYNC